MDHISESLVPYPRINSVLPSMCPFGQSAFESSVTPGLYKELSLDSYSPSSYLSHVALVEKHQWRSCLSSVFIFKGGRSANSYTDINSAVAYV